MKRRTLALILLGLLAYLGFLIATFPAGWAYALAKPHLEPLGVKLYAVEGTLWDGRVAALEIQGRRLPGLQWNLQPTALISGQLRAHIDLDHGHLDGEIAARPDGSLQAGPLEIHWPLPQLLQTLQLAALQLDGVLQGRLERLEVQNGLPRAADGTLTWRGAATRLPMTAKLGDLQLLLETRNDGIHGRFRDGGGPLGLGGTLQLSPDGAWRLELHLTPREGRQSPVGRLLAFLGRPDPQGKITLRRSGRLQATRP